MEKKRLHILTPLFTLMLIALFTLSADAYSLKTVDNVVYRMFEEDGVKKAIVCDFVDDEEITELNILSEVDGYKVTSVNPEPRVHYLTAVTEVTVGENIECLYDCTFIGFESLKKVNLPSTLTYIGERVFSTCTNLEKINLDYVTYIGTGAFSGCTSLKSVAFSENLEIIGSSSFANTGLETVTIPSKAYLKETELYAIIGDQFRNCKNLKKVIFEDRAVNSGFYYIEEYAFYGCDSLETVILPSNVSKFSIYDSAFENCKNLKAFDFSGITSISDNAFRGCAKITKADFSEKLEVIGCYAFAETGLKTVTIPSKTELKCRIGGENEHWDDTGNFEDFYAQFRNCKKLKTVVFEDREKSKFTIPQYTFEGCTALKKVYLPDNTKITVGPRAFKKCTSLTKVYSSENIVEIGTAAFSYCKSLKEITLGKNLKNVGEKAFFGCTTLAKVNLKSTKTVPTFGKKAFSGTADGIKFVADKKIAKKVKTNLKNTKTKNAKVYSVSYSKV